jgi:hypothetical protein
MKVFAPAPCHPEKALYCRESCRACYNKLPDIAVKSKEWRHGKTRKAWAKRYDKSPARATAYRRYRHAFTKEDEIRFVGMVVCDWCGFQFNGELPRIDHDRRCCGGNKHCSRCTRGFVHHRCNVGAIAYYEWIEKEFGDVDPKLVAYRRRFPVPRGKPCD